MPRHARLDTVEALHHIIWSKVASLRQHGTPEKGDERILGSTAFVMTVLKDTEEQQRRQVKALQG